VDNRLPRVAGALRFGLRGPGAGILLVGTRLGRPVFAQDEPWFGLEPLRTPADEDLHHLIAERYERTATVVASNLDFAEWDQVFPANRLLASAALDRLRLNADCLTLDRASYHAPRQTTSGAKPAIGKPPKNNQP
jgi:hypothetical protein